MKPLNHAATNKDKGKEKEMSKRKKVIGVAGADLKADEFVYIGQDGKVYPTRIYAEISGFKCLRCGYEWAPKRRDEKGRPIPPKNCPNPKCKSPYWDRPRGQKRGPKGRK